MDKIDIAIIGAGAVGLAVAAEISDNKKSIFVLEKEPAFGQHTSSRNSEVIHAGIYYKPGSLKARLCIEGNSLVYEICAKSALPHKKLTKIIVAADEHELKDLDKLFENAKSSGVRSLELLSKRQVQQFEPNVNAIAAIFSPETGIFDTHLLMKYFIAKAAQKGVEFSYNSEVIEIEKAGSGFKITVSGNDKDKFSFTADTVINCAGLFSGRIAAMAGIDIKKQGYELKYCKGQYFRASGCRGMVNRLVYPVPRPAGHSLGIHTVVDLAGNLRFGPDEHFMNENKIDYNVNEQDKNAFYESIIKILPSVRLNQLYPDISGIRPKLQGRDDGFRDFVIKEEKDLGLEGFINLIGIESPGLTASPAIAKMVKGMLR